MRPSRVVLPASLVAAVCGALAGLLVFAVAAALWRLNLHAPARLVAQAALAGCVAVLALLTVLDRPARMRRARVPVGRALPPQWWPPVDDALPALAVCAGVPLAAGAGAAALIFQ